MRPNSWSNSTLKPPPLPGADERWALFIDIDGTLADFREHPDHVSLDESSRNLIARLSGLLDGAVAVLSGRTLADVDRVLCPLKLPAGAMHGLQWRDPDGTTVLGAPRTDVAARVAVACRDAVPAWAGVWLEDKSGLAFAFHYRSAPAQETAVIERAQAIAAESAGQFVLQLGDCVAELRPVGADKGDALRAMLATRVFVDRRPVMLGDDFTDEAAFAAAQAADGLAIVVGARRPTVAGFALASPLAVMQWLGRLAERLQYPVTT